MAKDLEFFNEFFEKPETMKAREFYMYVHEWLAYLKEHEGEFNYLEDEEWRERKDRVLAVLNEQEDTKDEFEYLQDNLDSIDDFETSEKVEIYKEWLAFMKKNQVNYDISDEDFAKMEAEIKDAILKTLDLEVIAERLKRHKAKFQKSIANLDDQLAEFYVRTGRRLVVTSLAFKMGKRLKGN